MLYFAINILILPTFRVLELVGEVSATCMYILSIHISVQFVLCRSC